MRVPRRDEDRRLPPAAVAASAAIHVVLGLMLFRTTTSVASPPPPRTYRVELVSVAAEEAPKREEPKPAEEAREEHRPPTPQPTPRPKPETERPKAKKEKEVERPSREPARAAEEGQEAVNVQLEGANFPYPAYLKNIIRQINRYWRRPTGGRQLRAEISFVIHEDGAVSDIEWIRRSGDQAFDLEARGAVEAAGRAGAFGGLPDGYPRDQLRVSFFFDPSVR